MSRYPTINFQLSIMSKWLAKHIITKVSFKITIRKRHVYIDIRWLEYETSILFANLKWWSYSNDSFFFITARYKFKITEQKWNWVYNEPQHIKLYMNIGISNWHNWSYDPTKMKYFNLICSLHDYWPPGSWKS